jgi:2-oxoglutarate ferredoxin oxidoreductase subunit alpha
LENVVELFRFMEGQKRAGNQVVMNGNEAIAYGLIAAGVRFGAGYPITPWSDIMELLRRELPKYGGSFIQCEDEIASVSMAIGASYAGRVAITGSSGPGIALKTEAIGWAVMAEVPLVVVDVQRGGPSTGMPTNVEQSDLNIAAFGGHGDSPRVVIAPANVEDCFYTTIEAVNIARKYSVPVILLTDQAIATRIEAFRSRTSRRSARTSRRTSVRSRITSRTISLRRMASPDTWCPAPASRAGKYPIVTGLEHDEMGHPTGSPKLHMAMTAKRRRKLQALAAELPAPEVFGAPEGEVLLVGWGSTQGPIRRQ